jgi:D-glycero-D-manno-heptose 1,7-bisphosphate phosphatase
MKRAIFLDRDGTLIEDRDYLKDPAEVVFFPSTIPTLQKLAGAGFQIIIVTNQSGVGRGYFTMKEVQSVHNHITTVLRAHGVNIAAIFVAPEAPDQPSRGRKPSPAFLFDARDKFGIDLSRSYMIGDKLIDLECGWNAGVKASILVRTGYGKTEETKLGGNAFKAVVVDGLEAAYAAILKLDATP